jgi:hypothetical protein
MFFHLNNCKAVYCQVSGAILVFNSVFDRKVVILVGFPYKNLNGTLAFAGHLLSPTVSEASKGGRTDYYNLPRTGYWKQAQNKAKPELLGRNNTKG